jgi:outer membrane lipoprotein-sorting protein
MHRRLHSNTVLIAFCLALASAAGARALDSATTDPRAIMKAVSEQARTERASSRVKMMIRDKSGERERLVSMRSMRIEHGRKNLLVIESPADVRNTGFLSIDYDNGGRVDEQWLYLPKLKRVTRVPSSGKSDRFVGSDFSYSDMSAQDPDDYELKLIAASVKVGDEDCWQLESTPRTARVAEETGYKQSQIWVSKSKLVPIQMKAWLADGTHVKYFKATDLRKVDGIWTPHRVQMRTLQRNELESETVLEVLSVSNAAKDVSEDDFTQQRLEHGL